jgi:pyrroline-5-carboxylate reductase
MKSFYSVNKKEMTTGIIGYGSMGKIIEKSICKLHGETKILTSLAPQSVQNAYVAANSSDIFLCVKPNDMEEACREIRNHINRKTVVISIAAGVPYSKLQEWLNHDNVIKSMPTLSLPKGPVVIYNPLRLTFKTFSENNIVVDDENVLDMSTAISGCMPGFLANVLEQWIEAAVNLGMERKLAEKLIYHNASAFGNLDNMSLRDIQSMVSSKGGATERGLIYMNESELKDILRKTMKIANDRVLTFAKSFGE